MFGDRWQSMPVPGESQKSAQLSADDLAPASSAAPNIFFQVMILLALLGPFLIFFLMPGGGLIAPKTLWMGLLLCLGGLGLIFVMFAKLGDMTGAPPSTQAWSPEDQPPAIKRT